MEVKDGLWNVCSKEVKAKAKGKEKEEIAHKAIV